MTSPLTPAALLSSEAVEAGAIVLSGTPLDD